MYNKKKYFSFYLDSWFSNGSDTSGHPPQLSSPLEPSISNVVVDQNKDQVLDLVPESHEQKHHELLEHTLQKTPTANELQPDTKSAPSE